MELRQLELGPMANFVYIVGDPASKECAVVDPAWDVPAILKTVREAGWRLTRVFITHHHHDHINGLGELLSECDVPVHVHKHDAEVLKAFSGSLKPSEGGDKISLGRQEITLLHTPGHTEGSQCLLIEDRLVSGDTLFIGGCGRVDLPTSDPEKMYRSLRKLAALPDKTVLFPGHNYADDPSALLESEKRRNPYLKVSSTGALDDFLSLVGA